MDQDIENIQKIRQFTGHPGKFWPKFLELATRLAQAGTGVLLVQGSEVGTWKNLSTWPLKSNKLLLSPELDTVIKQLLEDSAVNGCVWDTWRSSDENGVNMLVLGLRLERYEAKRVTNALFIFDEEHEELMEETVVRLKLVADTPAIYERERASRLAMRRADQFSGAMDLMILINAEERYLAAAMTLVNEVSSRYQSPRVSLGWLDRGYVRLQAISHMERFEKKMDIVQTLEAAMEEAFDQNEEILCPPPIKSAAVVRDHEIFSRDHGVKFMVSVPIRLDDSPVGILTCERDKEPFSGADVNSLRVLCDQTARRLGDLKKSDHWFGVRMAATFRSRASRLLGVKDTFAKCIGLLLCITLAFFLFGKLTYRIEAPFILRSDDVRYLPAPFKGYIDEVHVKVGDEVQEGELLLTLDTTELLLEESAALANQIRYSRDAEKSRADNALADMKIAMALTDQATAQLDIVRYQLNRAEVRAPFKGIVVEGDLEELKGAPVTKGDVLFKVSRIENMYVELEVRERNIHDLAMSASGEMVFVSQPQLKFPIEVERIDPVAIAKKEEGNIFIVRCLFKEEMAGWWKPGMSGIAKVAVGKRNVLWILTHHTVDFFRIRLWW